MVGTRLHKGREKEGKNQGLHLLPPPPPPPPPTFSTDWCGSETSYDVTLSSVLPDNTPTPPGLPLPRQQGELLCPAGMCAMTHRLLSPTHHTHALVLTHMLEQPYTAADTQSSIVIHTYKHTEHHWVYSAGNGQRDGGGGGRMWGRTDGDVATGN